MATEPDSRKALVMGRVQNGLGNGSRTIVNNTKGTPTEPVSFETILCIFGSRLVDRVNFQQFYS